MKFNPFPEIASSRLILRKLCDDHIEALHNYFSSKENFEFVEMNVQQNLDETSQYVKKMNAGVEQDKWIIWAICLQESNEIIGTISLWNFNEEKTQAELGYGIFPQFRQSGYMLEALNLVIGYSFNILKLETVEAYTSVDNPPSNALLKKMEFEYVKTFEDEYSNNKSMNVYKVTR